MEILLIALWTISGILIFTDGRNRATRWMSIVAFTSGLAGAAELLSAYAATQTVPQYGEKLYAICAFIFSITHNVCPYTYIVYCVIYSGLFIKYRKFLLYTPYIFVIPVLIMYLIFPTIPEFDPSYPILCIWVVPYILFSNAILLIAIFKEKIPKVRIQRALTAIVTVPVTIFTMFANYLMRAFGVDDLLEYSALSVSITFVVFLIAAYNYGALGVRLKFEKHHIEDSIRVAASSASVISHAIKNELIKIDLSTENIRVLKEQVNNDDLQEHLNTIHESTTNLKKMTQKIARQTGEHMIHKSWNNLYELAARAIREMDVFLKNKEITTYIVQKEVYVQCDHEHIEEVLKNLINNAIDAMPRGGTLRVAYTETDKYTTMAISDNGSGISANDLPHICDPFYTTKHSPDNFGLGLSYCYSVMQSHDGYLKFDSTQDVGTTATLKFPQKAVYLRRFIHGYSDKFAE